MTLPNRGVVCWALLALGGACSAPPPGLREARKVELLDTMQRALLQSVEAEKAAVLAVTDEESTAFANQSRSASAVVEASRTELKELVERDGRSTEVEGLAAFSKAWAHLGAVDQKLLALAVENTNIKARRLADKDGAAAVNQLVDALQAVEDSVTDPKVLRELSRASVASLRIHALLAPHIASADDAEMTALEAQMRELSKGVDLALANARQNAPATTRARAAEAWEAWARAQHINADVIRLSRLNTNLLSFDLSVHEKHTVTLEAQAALTALLAEVQRVPRATR
jgi:hypothetical protein